MSATVNIPSSAQALLARATASCVSATPDKNGHVPPGSCNSFYQYYPSTTAAVIFAGIFLLTTLGHIFLAVKKKKGFCYVVIMGSLWEFGSFAIRAYSTKHQDKRNPALQSFLLFSLAPLWINAFVYMTAGRLIFCFVPDRKVFNIPAIWLGRTFIFCDILSFLIQLLGLIMIGPGANQSSIDRGLHVYQGGIAAQLAFIVIFIAISVGFLLKMGKIERTGWRDPHNRRWKLLLFNLLFVLLLIIVRVVYRLLEYLTNLGSSNPLPKHEIYMYVLDALPMLIALIALLLVHPGHVLVGPGSNYKEEKKKYKAQKKFGTEHGNMSSTGGSEEHMHMIGLGRDDVELGGHPVHQNGGNMGYLGANPNMYSPLGGGPESGRMSRAQSPNPPLYDPHH